jgi:murein DD-endopeptidase MepM/ murein hydrolase activator NlpD
MWAARWLLLLLPFAAAAQSSFKQGEFLRIEENGATAELNGKTVRIFHQANGSFLGLMPAAVLEKPGTYPLTIKDAAGKVLRVEQITITDARYPRQNIAATKAMKELTPLPGEMEAVRALQNTVSDKRFWAEPFIVPTGQCMNSRFGVTRYHNGKPTGAYHRGLDLRSPMGTPVRATAAGIVRISKMYRLHGGTIGIDHGQGVTSLYIHMSKLAVPEGTQVRQGDVVGYVGATGFATGPHLHWQISVNGVPVNPDEWLGDAAPEACRVATAH